MVYRIMYTYTMESMYVYCTMYNIPCTMYGQCKLCKLQCTTVHNVQLYIMYNCTWVVPKFLHIDY